MSLVPLTTYERNYPSRDKRTSNFIPLDYLPRWQSLPFLLVSPLNLHSCSNCETCLSVFRVPVTTCDVSSHHMRGKRVSERESEQRIRHAISPSPSSRCLWIPSRLSAKGSKTLRITTLTYCFPFPSHSPFRLPFPRLRLRAFCRACVQEEDESKASG